VITKQYYLGCLAHASYLVADEHEGVAAVVDPQRDVDEYVADARGIGCRIAHVFLTHFHADFVAGHLELRDRERAEIHLGARAQAEYAFTPMHDHESLQLGDVRLEVLETPGHSPESISILVYDMVRDAQRPVAVLTGDTLFVGDVGRPDLRASLGWRAEDLAEMLYASLREKLLPLPDETVVYPAHGPGSLCGRDLGHETSSTIGAQRRDNYALQPMDRAQFVGLVTADQPDTPAYFAYDAVLNTREHPTLDQRLAEELRPLEVDDVLRLAGRGHAQLLDTRDPDAFARGHLAGSINIGLEGPYATWAGTVLERERGTVVIADPGREREAATRLGRIGFDKVLGHLDGGMRALERRGDLIVEAERMTPAMLADRLASPRPPVLLDVRTERESREARIDGSLNLPLSRLPDRLDDVPHGRPIAVHCASGYRSSIAASLLRLDGHAHVSDLAGGFEAWSAVVGGR
jgi:hydroxyacylglutathione hydrolase